MKPFQILSASSRPARIVASRWRRRASAALLAGACGVAMAQGAALVPEGAPSAPVDSSKLEAGLIGGWQPNVSGAPMPSTQTYLGGSVLVFQLDHTVKTYAGCQPEREKMQQALDDATQTWTLGADQVLHMHAMRSGEALTMDIGVRIDGTRLVMHRAGDAEGAMFRYDGPLPPPCR